MKLARSRGDMNAPVVAGLGGAVLAALLEPDASGRAIKLAKVEGEHVTWGPELSEGRDESRYQRREREFGPFERRIELPAKVDTARVRAKLAGGVLEIVMPKHADSRPRRIEVKVG